MKLALLSTAETTKWATFRAQAEIEAWEALTEVFPRLRKYDAPNGRRNGFKFHRPGSIMNVDKPAGRIESVSHTQLGVRT